MALKFGPQWLRDLSDTGNSNSQSSTPTGGVKFKLADYRYGREEMLALYNEKSPPPDQVRKHQSIFANKIQSPVTLIPLSEDEQRLFSQGFNSTVVLRAAGRGNGPPVRGVRSGGSAERGRGRGRGRGEGFPHRAENGDLSFSRSSQEGWEQVGRKFGERNYGRGYEESGPPPKREFARSNSDNWRERRSDDYEEDDSGSWRNKTETSNRWGPPTRERSWRDRDAGYSSYDADRRNVGRSRGGFENDSRGPRRISENYENDEVPEWVEDDTDDPGSFDSGMFVSTKGVSHGDRDDQTESKEMEDKKKETEKVVKLEENVPKHKANKENSSKATDTKTERYVPPRARNGNGDSKDVSSVSAKDESVTSKEKDDDALKYAGKGDGDTGFTVVPTKDLTQRSSAPPGQPSLPYELIQQQQELARQVQTISTTDTKSMEAERFLHMQKSLHSLVTDPSNSSEKLEERVSDLSSIHEQQHKWFYRDPQGETQGPFTSDEMTQWFKAGYFTMNLMVKREVDDSFTSLGELIKQYGRMPFGLIDQTAPITPTTQPTEKSPSPPVVPTLPSPMSGTATTTPMLTSNIHDHLLFQQMMLQHEIYKINYIMRELQMQTLNQMQEQESFKNMSSEQQQQVSMQLMMQNNSGMFQQLQQFQQQQIQLQQRIQDQQQQQQQQNHHQQHHHQQQQQPPHNHHHSQQMLQPVSIIETPKDERFEGVQQHPFSHHMTAGGIASAMSSNNNSDVPVTNTDPSVWGAALNNNPLGVWSEHPSSTLWDVEAKETLTPAFQRQLDKLKKEREEERHREAERVHQERLQKQAEELLRQQEELERQKEQMRREKEEMERQKMIEQQKLEEARRREEEEMRRELERQRREQEEQKRKQEEEAKRRKEEEKKREKELKKQEEKRRKEEEKRKAQEEQKRKEEERRMRIEAEQEALRQQELVRQQMLLRQREEEERVRKEAEERKRQQAEKRMQMDLQRQQENLRRMQQAQREQLANIQLPAASNWGHTQQAQLAPSQSRSLTEIQKEEARRERERERQKEQQEYIQRAQEQTLVFTQQNQMKSWASHASQAQKGPSLLDIQKQEKESAKKTKQKAPKVTSQPTLSLAAGTTWSNSGAAQTAGWPTSAVDTNPSSSIWEPVAPASAPKKGLLKESGEFPALKNQNQKAAKKKEAKQNKKASKKKEEENVQKLFTQGKQQDGFVKWVTERVQKFSAPIDVPTFVSFIVDVDSPDDVKDYMKTYLGDNPAASDFARDFVDKRSRFRNQARLEKQLEEDSIWGPAPAINPHNFRPNNASSLSGEAAESGKNKKKKKQKMQKLDGSILGFTVHADPNRKNAAGEFESVQ